MGANVYLGDEQVKNNRTIVSTPKTSASVRKIHMIPKVRDAFLREKKMQELMGIKCTVEINGCTDFVFLTRNGGPKHVCGLNDALDNIVKTCNHEITTRFEEDSEGCGWLKKLTTKHFSQNGRFFQNLRPEGRFCKKLTTGGRKSVNRLRPSYDQSMQTYAELCRVIFRGSR